MKKIVSNENKTPFIEVSWLEKDWQQSTSYKFSPSWKEQTFVSLLRAYNTVINKADEV